MPIFAINEYNYFQRLEAEYYLLLCEYAIEVVVDSGKGLPVQGGY